MSLARRMLLAAAVALGTSVGAGGVRAEDAPAPAAPVTGIPSPSIATSLPNNGDPGGVRKWLAERGILYGLNYTGEAFDIPTGGIRHGSLYEGRLEGFLAINLETLLGLSGLSFRANAFQIHGTGRPRGEFVGNLTTISNIEALSTTRLSELWFEQQLFGGKANVRFGQLVVDSEFFVSDFSTLFLNSGWPTITAVNLPSGGAAYPMATPGVRLKIDPGTGLVFLAALVDGDPAGPGPGSAEEKNRHGLNFRVTDPPFLIAETQYKYNQGANDTGLAGALKVGGWHHFGRFDDQRFATDGLLLADPASSGIARRLLGDDGIYGIIDQQIYRPTGGGPTSGIGVFSRISASPSDRNLINFYLDGGIVFSGLVPKRPDDTFGATFVYSGISPRASDFDRDNIILNGAQQPVRNYELALEVSYQWQIVPGWTLQPDFQYIFHPGGYVPYPNAPIAGTPIKNAAIFGLRTYIQY